MACPSLLLVAMLALLPTALACGGDMQHHRDLQQFDAAPTTAFTPTPAAALPNNRTRPLALSPRPKPNPNICLEPTYKMDTTRFDTADGLPFFTDAGLDPSKDPATNVNQTYMLPTSDSIARRVQQLGAPPQEQLDAIARTHTLAAPAGYLEFSTGADTQLTLQGDTRTLPAPFNCLTKGRVAVSFYITQENEYIVEAPGSSASILGPHDIPICRGNIVHVIDDLLFPCCFTMAGLRTRARLAPYLPAAAPAASVAIGGAAPKPAVATLATAATVTPAKAGGSRNGTRAALLDATAVLGSLRAKILALVENKDEAILAAFIPTATDLPASLAALLTPLSAADRDTALTRLARYHVSVTALKLKNLVSGQATTTATTLRAASGFAVADATAPCSGLLALSFAKVPTLFRNGGGSIYNTLRQVRVKADNNSALAVSHYHLCGGQIVYFVDQLLLPCDLSTDPTSADPGTDGAIDPITGLPVSGNLTGGSAPLGSGNTTGFVNPILGLTGGRSNVTSGAGQVGAAGAWWSGALALAWAAAMGLVG